MHIALVILVSALAYLSATDIYTPSMPSIAKYFSASEDMIQLSMTMFMTGAIVSTLISGALSENYGKRNVALKSQVLFIAASILCAFAPDQYTLITARFFQGLGAPMTYVIGYSIVQDIYSPKESTKIFAQLGVAFAVIPAVAPILGGYIDYSLGWRANFIAILLVSLISIAATAKYFVLPTDSHIKAKSTLKQILEKYKTVATDKVFARYTITYAILLSLEWCFITLLPFYFAKTIGVSSMMYGNYLGGMVLFYAVGSYMSPKLIDKVGNDKTIIIAISISIFSGLLLYTTSLYAAQSAIIVSFVIGISMLAQGMLYSPTITKSLAGFKGIRSSASSVRGGINSFFCIIGTIAASLFDDYTLAPTSMYIIVASILSLLIFYVLREK